jgi:D-3-phosphoglycerate dehydrogenase
MAAAPQLKIVVRAGAGYDNVDCAAATERGIVVMNTPGQNANAVAELALGMMIYMSRNTFKPGTGKEVSGKKLGIHGYGNIGQIVGRYGKALGMEVYALSPSITDMSIFENNGVTRVETAEELYKTCDYISLHIPATAKYLKSVDRHLLESMPKGAILVNTARKEVVNEEDLMAVLGEREDLKYASDIAAACQAELVEKYGNRVFATPKKQGAETAEANYNAAKAAATQIVDFFVNGNRKFQVNK